MSPVQQPEPHKTLPQIRRGPIEIYALGNTSQRVGYVRALSSDGDHGDHLRVSVASFDAQSHAFLGQVNHRQVACANDLKCPGHQLLRRQGDSPPPLEVAPHTEGLKAAGGKRLRQKFDSLPIPIIRVELDAEIRFHYYITRLASTRTRPIL